MNDIDICKRIAEIDGVDFQCNDERVMYWRDEENSPVETYNPLTDDALCFRLMVKYDMPPFKLPDYELYECVYDMDLILSGAGSIVDKSPNKAILLAIIEANK